MSSIHIMQWGRNAAPFRLRAEVLGFQLVCARLAAFGSAYAGQSRREGEWHQFGHRSSGIARKTVSVIVDYIECVFARFASRGADSEATSGSHFHPGPLDQAWEAREVCDDDVDGNRNWSVDCPVAPD